MENVIGEVLKMPTVVAPLVVFLSVLAFYAAKVLFNLFAKKFLKDHETDHEKIKQIDTLGNSVNGIGTSILRIENTTVDIQKALEDVIQKLYALEHRLDRAEEKHCDLQEAITNTKAKLAKLEEKIIKANLDLALIDSKLHYLSTGEIE